jgi:plasmid stabilization system protein ParE
LTARIIRVHPAAVEETAAAADWYLERSARAAESFLKEIDRVIARISQHPESFPHFDFGTRRANLRTFPYLIVFREREAEIEIIAIAHGRRRPGYWRNRG